MFLTDKDASAMIYGIQDCAIRRLILRGEKAGCNTLGACLGALTATLWTRDLKWGKEHHFEENFFAPGSLADRPILIRVRG